MADNTKVSALAELAQIEAAHREYLAQCKVAAARSGPQGYDYPLHDPILVNSQTVTSLHFRPQTIKDLREAKGDPALSVAPNDALTAALCNVQPAVLLQLSVLDYEAIQEVMEGFTLRRAAGGLKPTS